MFVYDYKPDYDRVWYMKLKYTINGSQTPLSAGDIVVINLPAGLTVRARKMHRACLNYKITGGYVKDSEKDRVLTFATAFDNWVTRAAIKRGRNHWLESHREIFKNNPGLKPKWHDYKPALIKEQIPRNAGTPASTSTQWVPEDYANITLPHDDRGQTFSVFTTESGVPAGGNIGSANLVDLDKDEFTSHIIGTHEESGAGATRTFTSVGLIESWFRSRPDINPITTISDAESDAMEQDPLNLLFDDGDADNEKIENFGNATEGDGDREGDMYPMYSNNVINSLEEVACVYTSTANPVSYFTGFTALTGQVAVRFGNSLGQNQNVEIVFEVDPQGMTI